MFFGEPPGQESFESLLKFEIFSTTYFDGWRCFVADRDPEAPEAVLGVGVESQLELERGFISNDEGLGEFEDGGLIFANSSGIDGPSGSVGIRVE